MIRLLFIAVVVFLVLVAGSAVLLHHFFGWKGLAAFPLMLILLLWVGKKAVGFIFKRAALSLFSMKARVLRHATIAVHSVTPVAKPEFDRESDDGDGEGEDGTDGDATEAGDEDDAGADDIEDPQDFFAVDLTITPQDTRGDAVWEPGELVLSAERTTNLMDYEDDNKQLGQADKVEVWNGSTFGPDDGCKYPGEQRLRITFGVKPSTAKAWLCYYSEPLGTLDFPRWQLAAS